MKRLIIAAIALALAGPAMAQDLRDLDRRMTAIEEKLQKLEQGSDVAELRREIDVLSREIEALKNVQEKPAAQANVSQYGLGAAASKVYRSAPGLSIGGYGEFVYQNFRSGETDTADWVRAVVYTGYKFNDRMLFNSETEIEHGNLEHGGNVEMEFGYLDYLVKPQFNLRAGLVLMPVGLINELHEPTAYFGARRPAVEDRIIPTTWSEAGVGAFGDVGRLTYRAYLVTGLQSSRFDAQSAIREGRQGAAEAAAGKWAAVGRLDFHPVEGTLFGGSLYSGNSGQDSRFNARVTLGEVHAESKFRGLTLRGLYARGTTGDAARINEANGLAGDASIGKSFGGWYAEGGYQLFTRGDFSLTPYTRIERFDTQRSVPAGYLRNPENNRRLFTIGLAAKPVPQTVIKFDWQKGTNRARTGTNQFNVGLGYIF